MQQPTVRAVNCSHRASRETILERIREVTAPLSHAWERLGEASSVLVKANVIWPPDEIERFQGRRRELVDDDVLWAVLTLLRERTSADISLIDTTLRASPAERPGPEVNVRPLLEEFGVQFIDANEPPFEIIDVPGGGQMFARYQLHASIAEADAMVSVAKLKNHGFMGITGCTKNLFGLPPIPPHGRSRTYFHHIMRLPYVLADLARIMQPCLNIIDGLVGQSGREWGGSGRVCDAFIAGDHPVATDAVAAHLMGHDPASDWPTPPFRRDRNHLLVSAESGYGTVDLNAIDYDSDLTPPLAAFDSDEVDSAETVTRWRRSTCEQAIFYRDHMEQLASRYRGEYIFLQDGEVVWHGADPGKLGSRRDLSGRNKDSALFLKKADPEEAEDERWAVYEKNLVAIERESLAKRR